MFVFKWSSGTPVPLTNFGMVSSGFAAPGRNLRHITDGDVERTIRGIPRLCTLDSIVIWTRHRRDPELTPLIPRWRSDAGCETTAFESPGPGGCAVGSTAPIQRRLSRPHSSDSETISGDTTPEPMPILFDTGE